jgi:methanogenic corrinoid protein MtbC1
LFEKLGADGQALDAEEAIKMAEGFILEKEKNTLSPV